MPVTGQEANPASEPAGNTRIVHVVDSLERGGLERFVADLASSQRVAGHAVAVFCLYRRGPIAAELESAGIAVACGEKRRGLDLRAILRLRRFASRQRAQVVHAHNLVPNYYAALALLGLRRRFALVDTLHDMGTRFSEPRLRRLFLWSIPRTSAFAMVAENVRDRYVDSGMIPSSRARTIRNGIPQRPSPWGQPERLAARQRLGIPGSALLVGCVGRLVELKNHRLVIEALASLAPQVPGLRVVLIGGGPLAQELEALAAARGVAQRVTMTGERADVRDLLPALDIFALPSRSEGMSIALIEAASAGLPIVATRVGGNTTLVKDEETGLLVPCDDLVSLTAAILRLAEDEGLRRGLGAAARQFALRETSIDVTRAQYDALYREAVAHTYVARHEARQA